MTSKTRHTLLLCSFLAAASGTARAGQPLETESARLLKRGTVNLAAGIERQTSVAGSEFAVPFAFEYGVTDRLELTVEPVAHTAIRDKGAPRQVGPGDLEATLTTMLLQERAGFPALALAGEVKLPTAHNTRIGTGKTDFSLSLLASKRVGPWDTHANLGYTIIGKPAGADVTNVVSFAVAGERPLGATFNLVSEIFGSTGALKEAGAEGAVATAESQLTPELGGGEIVGTVGLQMHASRGLTYSLGLSVDGNKAILIHPGIAIQF